MSATGGEPAAVEASGETVGEAKWNALRDLERLLPGLDRDTVRFQVLSEGERGLLGVGFSPARVLATADATPPPEQREPPAPRPPESPLASRVRGLVEHAAAGIGLRAQVDVREDERSVTATCSGADLALLIGRHGQTIDAVQYLVNAIVARELGPDRKEVVVDAAGYRDRRRASIEAHALRVARRVAASGEAEALEPMTPVERKLVHLCLRDVPGVATTSDGTEPNRHVVVEPAAPAPAGE